MNKEFIKTKTVAVFISIVAMLSVSAIAIPMQSVQAQTTQCNPTAVDCIVVRLVGAVGQAGLVNIAVNNVPILILNQAQILSDNTVNVQVQANVPVTVCAVSVNVIGASGPQSCDVVNTSNPGDQEITLPVRPAQAQGNTNTPR